MSWRFSSAASSWRPVCSSRPGRRSSAVALGIAARRDSCTWVSVAKRQARRTLEATVDQHLARPSASEPIAYALPASRRAVGHAARRMVHGRMRDRGTGDPARRPFRRHATLAPRGRSPRDDPRPVSLRFLQIPDPQERPHLRDAARHRRHVCGLATSRWHAEIAGSVGAPGTRQHLLSFGGLDDLIHADTMLFILGLTFFVSVIAQTRSAGRHRLLPASPQSAARSSRRSSR